jgi:predicted molibdopterin-dependent oxidoreductase YjgC
VVAIVGRTGLTEDPALATGVAKFAAGLSDATVLPVTRRPNAFGAVDMGLAPGVGPGRARAAAGRDATEIISGLEEGALHGLVLLGVDPVADHPSGRGAAALDSADFVVAIDLFLTESSRMADVVFPAAGFAEVEGTMTNLEGRVQKLNRLVPAPGQARPVTEILGDLAARLGEAWGSSSAASFAAGMSQLPGFGEVSWESLDWGEGRDGIVVQGGDVTPGKGSGGDGPGDGLALHLARVLYDGGTAVSMGPSLARLRPDPAVHVHPEDADRLGLDGAARVTGSAGAADLAVVRDPSLAPGTVYVPFNLGVRIGSAPGVTVEAAP